jgi:hypothetical protein
LHKGELGKKAKRKQNKTGWLSHCYFEYLFRFTSKAIAKTKKRTPNKVASSAIEL